MSRAVRVADLFLDKGVIVSIRGRMGTELEHHKASKQNTWSRVKILVLVDQNTASAAEIVASALQEHGRAQLLGLKTFGKGSVQTFFVLNGGSGFKMTTAHYLSPNGQVLEGRGISPDIHVEMFAPEVITAGPPRSENIGDTGAESGDVAPEGGRDLDVAHIPERLRDDHQFDVAYQTARKWLVSD